ncbi:MAG: hypothetical protein ACKOFD_09065, partial [Actinomycetota bacterium]
MSTNSEVHRRLAVEANNSTWEILGKPLNDISENEAEEMVRRAYAAAYHWQRAEGATPANEARASWLLSRVWVVLSNGKLALHHAQRCLSVCESAGLVDFDLVYAHESLARSFACLGEIEQAHHHLSIARHVEVADPEDRSQVEADLKCEPWFKLDIKG